MGFRSLSCKRQCIFHTVTFILLGVPLTLILSGCLDPQRPVPAVGENNSSNARASTSQETQSYSSYRNASATKVIFNKQSFFNNSNPNNLGCAGDARFYYDPVTDRQVPVKPDWLKNIAVDITNSNAFNGPSRAASCSLSGSGSATASNCATFDDLQPLQGSSSRTVMIGGFGCQLYTSGCQPDSVLSDIWTISVPDISTGSAWLPQPGSLPSLDSSLSYAPGALWAAGDYDELHDEYYVYGGVSPNTSTAAGSTLAYSDKMIRIQFTPEGSVSTSPVPSVITPSTSISYGGWLKTNQQASLAVPGSLTGSTLTYSMRRDPSFKSWCNKNDSNACTGSSSIASHTAVAENEHHDYLLLVGGLNSAGTFSDKIFIYKPHGFSNDVGTNAPTGGDWNLVSNITTSSNLSSKIMSVSTIGSSSNERAPFIPQTSGVTWDGRGYHRTVYDPTMNRFYIFGGLKNTSGAAANTTAPTATNEFWIYDPPAIGRRPTSMCYTYETPDNVTLPSIDTTVGNTPNGILFDSANGISGARFNLGANQSYINSRIVFPPGGCLQKIPLGTNPDARFEHSMAFDRNQKAVIMFGGSNTASTISLTNNTAAGDPTLNSTSSHTLLNDTWVYIPPTATEIVPDYFTADTGAPHPYDSSNPIANIFKTNFWLDHFAKYINEGSEKFAPRYDEVFGTWVKLTPTVKPTARVSASFIYDRAHYKFYLYGGYGCTDSSCSQITYLNDTWEFTPPLIATECNRELQSCSSQGVWKQIRSNNMTDSTQPTIRKGALMAYAQPMFSYGDDFYTVRDSFCTNQGPIATNDPSQSKQYVGSIYIDLDRTEFSESKNILINLRFLPFDENTKLPGWYNSGTNLITNDDIDASSTSDRALIRVQLLSNALKFTEQIQSLIQPRFHDFLSGTPVLVDTLMFAAGASGQISEKQILVPLRLSSSINLIKIERIQGSVKFYEMTLSEF